MFVQIVNMRAPDGEVAALRKLVKNEYLPALNGRQGFLSAQLLEKVDDRENTKLVVYWEDYAALDENTGVLSGSVFSIAARLPGLRVTKESYIVDVNVQSKQTYA